jgi:hypothetical protein
MERTLLSIILAAVVLCMPLAAMGESADETKTMHAYYVGNSAVRCITMDRLHALMADRGIDFQYGTQTGAGTTLKRNWELAQGGEQFKTNTSETNKPAGDTFDPAGPDGNPYPIRFGRYDKALAEYAWDALILTVYGSHIEDDQAAIRNFINLTLATKSVKQIYFYQIWCRRRPLLDAAGKRTGEVARIDYAALWAKRKYRSTGMGWDTFNTRDYSEKLIAAVNAEFAGKLENPVRVIPAGDVYYELDQRLKAGKIPGLPELYARDPKAIPGWDPATGAKAGANILYADGIHPNPIPHLTGNIANYAIAMTHLAVLTGRSPVGLSGKLYGLDDEKDAALIRALQETVWDVVSKHPDAGIRKAGAENSRDAKPNK